MLDADFLDADMLNALFLLNSSHINVRLESDQLSSNT